MGKGWGAVIACAALCAMLWAAPAEAAFPGQNGKIAFVRGRTTIWTMNEDGTNPTADTRRGPAASSTPTGLRTAPGSRYASTARRANRAHITDVRVMNADSTDERGVDPPLGSYGQLVTGRQPARVRYATLRQRSIASARLDELVVADVDGFEQAGNRGAARSSSSDPILHVDALNRRVVTERGRASTFRRRRPEVSSSPSTRSAQPGGSGRWPAARTVSCNYRSRGQDWSPDGSASWPSFVGDSTWAAQDLYTMNQRWAPRSRS